MNFVVENLKNSKTILIVSGLVAVIVFSALLVGYENYLRTTAVGGEICGDGIDNDGDGLIDEGCGTTTTCSDPDGENLFVKGTTKQITGGHTSTYYDQCQNGKVHEWYCQGNQAKVKNISCPVGYSCVGFTDGKCTKVTSPEICDGIDNDGDGLVDEGNLCQSGYKCQNGTCVKEEPTCACGEWTAQTCGGGSCPDTDMHWTRTCAPSGCDSESKCLWDSICNASCEEDGKCKYPGCPNGDSDCACSQQNGNICQANEICPEASLKHKDSGICCPVSCIPEAIYSISGQITTSENISVSGINMNLTGTSSASTATNSDGNYSFINLANGSYTITPSKSDYIFNPVSQNITISGSNSGNRNFNAISKECNLEETKNYTCPDGTEVDWCSCDNYKWACIDSPENNCPATCTCGEWTAQTCGGGSCPSTDMHWTRTCTPTGCDGEPESKCWWDSICNASCEADGKCKTSGCPTGDPDCSCLEQNGYICNGYVGETCPGVSLLNNYEELLERNFCCSVACEGSAIYQTADLDCDGKVGAGDIAIVLSWWDRNPSGFTCCQTPDIDSDGTANAGDYAIILSQWTFDTF